MREEWLDPVAKGKTIRHLQFLRCTHCHQTLAMIASPETEETKWSMPDKWSNHDIDPGDLVTATAKA